MGIISMILGTKGNTLYYPGCLLKGPLKEQFENYKEIFNRLGIDFIMLPEKEVCCGLPVLNGGYKKDIRNLAHKNFKLFREKNIKKIITSCPSCYHTFKTEYPKLVHAWKEIEVEHATISILNALRNNGIKFRRSEQEREIVTYHDPCHLGRYEGIYKEPREVIELLGGKILEMRYNKENALCCGGGGGVRANFPILAKSIANIRIKEIPSQAGKIISPCGLCFANLSSAENGGKKSEEFSSFVLRKLNGLKK